MKTTEWISTGWGVAYTVVLGIYHKYVIDPRIKRETNRVDLLEKKLDEIIPKLTEIHTDVKWLKKNGSKK